MLVSISTAVAAGDANMTGCSNEALAGFREYLPDCRAYEMVTPPFKDGGGPTIGFEAVSGDGSHVLAHSLGAYAETESDAANGARYEFSRLGSGWMPSPISPPASLFSFNEFLAGATDLGSTLWAVRGSSQSLYTKDLYVRDPDGTFVKVGPMVPPSAAAGPPAGSYQQFLGNYNYAGASSDLSHVLFQVLAFSALWPGDTTVEGSGQPSLYEYVGRINARPELIGVDAGGQLISNCGTTLGLESDDEYNAVSANGEAVFFTSLGHNAGGCEPPYAVPSELYAHLGEGETVAISEPAHSQCLESICNTAVKAPAEFQGASEDGSKVFFLTEQELFLKETPQRISTSTISPLPLDARSSVCLSGRQHLKCKAWRACPRTVRMCISSPTVFSSPPAPAHSPAAHGRLKKLSPRPAPLRSASGSPAPASPPTRPSQQSAPKPSSSLRPPPRPPPATGSPS